MSETVPDRPEADLPGPPGQSGPPPGPPTVADGLEHSLDPRFVTLGRMGAAIAGGVLGSGSFVGILIYLLVGSPPAWIAVACGSAWLGGVLLLCWVGYRWPAIEHRHASWRLDELGIRIRSGVWWRSEVTIPRSRVQHTDVSQGPIERSLGLGTLVVFTAGTEHARVELKGLEHSIALGIRDHLLPSGREDAV